MTTPTFIPKTPWPREARAMHGAALRRSQRRAWRSAHRGCLASCALALGACLSAEVSVVPTEPSALQQQLGDLAAARLALAIGTYRQATGRHPMSLDDLVARGLIQPGDLQGPFEESFSVARRVDGGIQLLRPWR